MSEQNRNLNIECGLTLKLLTWKKWWAPASASKWRMGFNSAFKEINLFQISDFFLLSQSIYCDQLSVINSRQEIWSPFSHLNDQRIVVRLPAGATGFSLLRSLQTGSVSQPASYIVGVMQSGHETDNLSSASAEIKNEWG